jgi:hypothetical protein
MWLKYGVLPSLCHLMMYRSAVEVVPSITAPRASVEVIEATHIALRSTTGQLLTASRRMSLCLTVFSG